MDCLSCSINRTRGNDEYWEFKIYTMQINIQTKQTNFEKYKTRNKTKQWNITTLQQPFALVLLCHQNVMVPMFSLFSICKVLHMLIYQIFANLLTSLSDGKEANLYCACFSYTHVCICAHTLKSTSYMKVLKNNLLIKTLFNYVPNWISTWRRNLNPLFQN